jgi:cyclopropane-fatty-acyl-phospholipid synthase
MRRWIEKYAKKKFFEALKGIQDGYLELVCPEETYSFGDPHAALKAMAIIHDERFFSRAAMGADVGIGESYMDGEWTSPDMVSLVRLVTRNLRLFDSKNKALSALRRMAFRWQHRRRDNSVPGSRENIRAHYDLGNDFYRLFLDQQMMYSSGYFQKLDESLEEAQIRKMDLICRKLRIDPGDRVLEIGCGWGAFTVHAARNYGAHVTGVTISPAQYEAASERIAKSDVTPGSVKLVMQDYRLLQGEYDKIVSIEMFEAVGLAHYDEFFKTCDRLLTPDGSMLMQTITIPDRELAEYQRRVDWIQTYIFPGSELAFVSEIQRSLAKETQMSLANLENFGMHYARTLSVWRERFFQRLSEVQKLGFDERFQRMWDFYLAWCEGAFRERYINVAHLLLAKNGTGKALLGDPVYAHAVGVGRKFL